MLPAPTARAIIDRLNLQPLPGEGGFFRATWRSEASSAIFFLLTGGEFSAFHQLDREELWHYYSGQPIDHFLLDPASGGLRVSRMGPNVLAGDQPQVVVPGGCWQAARMVPNAPTESDFALVGCTVAPPWEDRGFTLGRREGLIRSFPLHAELIRALTR